MCLEKGTESYINRFDETQRNAVMYACENHQTACLEEILKSGKCNPEFSRNKAILHHLHYLISHSLTYSAAPTNSKGNDILHLAESSRYSGQAIIDKIVQGKEKADIWATNTKGENLLMIAARRSLVDVVKHCVSGATFHKSTCQLIKKGNTAIMHACSHDNLGGSENLQCLVEILKSDAAFSKRDTDSLDKFRDIDAEIYG